MSFSELRNGAAGQAGYLGSAYNPFVVEGAAGNFVESKADPHHLALGGERSRDHCVEASPFEQLNVRPRAG